ncbi:MAG: hypothetical protein KGI37_04120 [Alphaproteobacteria bacterium]|nr:hypothetical protein [Alphaproteobacteria bacterium]
MEITFGIPAMAMARTGQHRDVLAAQRRRASHLSTMSLLFALAASALVSLAPNPANMFNGRTAYAPPAPVMQPVASHAYATPKQPAAAAVAPAQVKPVAAAPGEITHTVASAPASTAPSAAAILAESVNESLLQKTHHMLGERYSLNDQKGVNCSTFVARVVLAAMAAANHKNNDPVFDIGSIQPYLIGTSENMVLATQLNDGHADFIKDSKIPSITGGDLLASARAGTLLPGTIIGFAFDHRQESFAAGRKNNISHVAIVIRDKNGVLSVAESAGGVGVHVMPLDAWVKLYANVQGGARFYTGNPFVAAATAAHKPVVEAAFLGASSVPDIRLAQISQSRNDMAGATTALREHHPLVLHQPIPGYQSARLTVTYRGPQPS